MTWFINTREPWECQKQTSPNWSVNLNFCLLSASFRVSPINLWYEKSLRAKTAEQASGTFFCVSQTQITHLQTHTHGPKPVTLGLWTRNKSGLLHDSRLYGWNGSTSDPNMYLSYVRNHKSNIQPLALLGSLPVTANPLYFPSYFINTGAGLGINLEGESSASWCNIIKKHTCTHRGVFHSRVRALNSEHFITGQKEPYLKYFKAIDIQNTHYFLACFCLCLRGKRNWVWVNTCPKRPRGMKPFLMGTI